MFKRNIPRVLALLFSLFLFDLRGLVAAPSQQSDSAVQRDISRGIALRQQGEFHQAISLFDDALNAARVQDDARAQLECLMNLGVLNWDIGQIKDSDRFYRQALLLSQKLGLKDIEAKCTAYIRIYETYVRGKEAYALGSHQDSIAQFTMAISLSRKFNSPEHELKCLRQMSLNYYQLEHYSDFLALNQRGLDIAQKLNHKREEGRCLNNIGIHFYEINSYSKALIHFEKAISIIRETYDNQVDLSACLNNIGLIFRELGDYERAIPYFEEALKIDCSMKDEEGICIDLNNLGSTYHRKSKNEKNERDLVSSLDFYFGSLEMIREGKNKKLLVNILNNIAVVFGSLKRYSLSLKYFRSALHEAALLVYDYESCNIYSNIGHVLCELGDYVEAGRCFFRALQLASKVERKDVLWEAYLGLGRCSESMRQSGSALANYRKAIKVIEIMRGRIALDDYKVGFGRDKMKTYEALLNLLHDLKEKEKTTKYDREIFEVVEKAKARAFLEELGRADRTISSPYDQDYKKEESSLSKKISLTISELIRPDLGEVQRQRLMTRLELEEDEYTSFLNRIRTETAEYSGIASPQVISADRFQEQYLDGMPAILEYFLGDKRSFGILVTKNNFLLKVLPSKGEIENSLRAYLKMLSTPPVGSFQGIPAARRIYRDLVFPFQEALSQDTKHLVFIPDGILHYLPFETLVRDDGRTGEPRYLIELYDISYAPSVSSLVYLQGKERWTQYKKALLAVGAPSYFSVSNKRFKGMDRPEDALRDIFLNDGFELTALPYSKREVHRVARYFPDDEVELISESRANEENIKSRLLDEYQIIHFACHGFLDEKAPMRSALVLTLDDDPNEDGFLQAREISKLRLNADLIVLSACQTGKGRLENAEGVLGLPRSFFYAGARSTISSLWKINDKSTSEIMPDFYRYLVAGNNKVRSLRLAKLSLLRSRFSHPFYWAAFVLNGDYSRDAARIHSLTMNFSRGDSLVVPSISRALTVQK